MTGRHPVESVAEKATLISRRAMIDRTRPGAKVRAGLTILEVLVSLVILAVIGAAVLSTTNPERESDQARVQAVAEKLEDLREVIAGYEATGTATSFRQTIGALPSRLSHLTTPISTAQTNSCGQAYTGTAAGTQVAIWLLSGPYYTFEMKAAGTPLGQGFTPQDLLIKTPVGVPVGNQAGTLTIRFPSVAIDDANALELIVDGIANTTAGHVRFVPAGTAPVQVDYLMSVYGC